MSPLPPETFAANARAALQDAGLRSALKRATGVFAERRAAAVGAVEDWEELRERARRIKEDSLLHLDRWLERFERAAVAAGTRVHWARDGREACELVAGIARAAGARRLVKSKSMTSEEIGLNHALAHSLAEPVETDLGEWIIQLAGETPSHIIVPAIHKTRGQIGELFVEKLRIPPTDDVQELARAARDILRRHFAEADLGVSGVNFAVAETGSILILENEGNVRMTTTLPRVHVALMGIEKVIPRHDDLAVFLRLLPRSGTGQHLTSYQSILTGPVNGAGGLTGPGNRAAGLTGPASAGETGGEGPEELHVILLDNGRSELLRERVTRQTLACIRCGACLNACPVYQAIGGHAYGSVYPGPIGAILSPQLPVLGGTERAGELPFASSLCGACREVCPVKIDIPEVLLELRSRVIARRGTRRAQSSGKRPARRLEHLAWRVWAWAMTGPARYSFLARLARALARVPPLQRRLPPFAAWSRSRELPRFAARSFRELWREGP